MDEETKLKLQSLGKELTPLQKRTRAKWVLALILLVLCSFAAFVMSAIQDDSCCMCGNPDNECCPCPNPELINLVEDYTGQQASSAGSWLYICNKYKDETNDSRECFE